MNAGSNEGGDLWHQARMTNGGTALKWIAGFSWRPNSSDKGFRPFVMTATIEMWGDAHLRQVITWFEKAESKR